MKQLDKKGIYMKYKTVTTVYLVFKNKVLYYLIINSLQFLKDEYYLISFITVNAMSTLLD